MKSILFCAPAKKFSIGEITQIEISINQKLPRDVMGFDERNVTNDAYGDSVVSVRIPITSAANWPAFNFRVLNQDGSTGFDSLEDDHPFLHLFAQKAHLLIEDTPCLRPLGDDALPPRGALSLVSSKNYGPCPLTFHDADIGALHAFWDDKRDFPSRKEPEFWSSALFGSLNFCKSIAVWSFAYGTNLTILSRAMPGAIKTIQQNVDLAGYEVIQVPEFALPEW
jgi:hypothetical protein